MEKVTIIGLDIAKQVFQVHGINEAGAIVCRRRLRRDDVVAFFKVLPPGVGMLIALVEDGDHDVIPPLARSALPPLTGQLRDIHGKVSEMDCQIHAWHRANVISRRLETIPGIGPISASAIAATVTDATLFKSGRQLAAWIGLVPRQNSSGGKDRLGRISKQGDPYLRRLLVVGAHAVLRFSRNGKTAATRWEARATFWSLAFSSR